MISLRYLSSTEMNIIVKRKDVQPQAQNNAQWVRMCSTVSAAKHNANKIAEQLFDEEDILMTWMIMMKYMTKHMKMMNDKKSKMQKQS